MTQQHTQAADPVNVNIFSPSPARLSVSLLTCVSFKFMLKVSSFLLVFCPCLSVLSIRKTLLLQIKRCSRVFTTIALVLTDLDLLWKIRRNQVFYERGKTKYSRIIFEHIRVYSVRYRWTTLRRIKKDCVMLKLLNKKLKHIIYRRSVLHSSPILFIHTVYLVSSALICCLHSVYRGGQK